RLVGFRVSPILWTRYGKNELSAGRVQSVALRLICEREGAIDLFEPEEYWNLTAHFQPQPDVKFAAKLSRIGADKAEVGNEATALAVQAAAQSADFSVGKVTRTRRKQKAQPPFITSTLQQAASSNLRMSPSQTMQIAQELYEGVELDGEPVGMITYMRTDSVNIAKEAQAATREYVEDAFGAEFLPKKPRSFRSRGNAQEAHEAIRPTDVTRTPAELKKLGLSAQQLKLYELIWCRFVASQMSDSESEIHAIEIVGKAKEPAGEISELTFRASASKIVFAGYQKVYALSDTEDSDESDELASVPDLNDGHVCTLAGFDSDQKFTEPPPRFSEATLVRELERNGIGRPSTYAAITRTIVNRKYVNREQRKLVPTDLGQTVNGFLIDKLSELFAVDFTARMESDLDQVEQGEREWRTMMSEFYRDLTTWVERALALPDTDVMNEMLALFGPDTEYAQNGRGRQRYDDKKFVEDLKARLEKGQKLSERQWDVVIGLLVKYEEQLPQLEAVAEKYGLTEKVGDQRAVQAKRNEGSPSSMAISLCNALEAVETWEPPTKKGRRTYDDQEFFLSLKDRVDAENALSQPQEDALRKLIEKYCTQLPDYDQLAETWSLVSRAVREELHQQIGALIAMSAEIKEFPAPVKRGRRTFDEKDFVDSLTQQFEAQGKLSDRQVGALKKVLGRHAKEITDFETRSKELGIESVNKETGFSCPDCDDGKILVRSSRGRTFYGCNGYPKCQFTAKDLTELEPSASSEAAPEPAPETTSEA
ncbi:MAG TPA: type I DNA topoisomerase, partial [Lentisphaeria bacterium]|nr:type I DNA topoisomerase [Lentisphaeria bacterium]